MLYLTLVLLVLFMLLPALLGLMLLWYTLILPKKAPADTSNRIGHMRLVWFAMRTPEKFVGVFPWLRKDEGDLVERGQ